MATRSLTEVFILMRNNALQNRHLFSDQVSKSRSVAVSVIVPSDTDKLLAQGSTTPTTPEAAIYFLALQIQFEISRIKEKMRELHGLHDKYLNRPTLDDNVDEEHAIDILTQEITHMFMRSQRLVQQINNKGHLGSSQEQKLTLNIVSSLARTLQEMSTNFRKAQSSYLRKLRTREERSNQYFGTDLMPVDSQAVDDLDEIYERGTLLDRIDYNIEATSVQVDKGLKQLQKAEKYQKKNRKMLIILVLFTIIIIMIIVLIFIKS
ncbi:hypothetical protein LSH36_37g10091 [Paralvinella palmiformis]|uniref:t-SNARE coiled-coil homology domain-containing protein n=1 Tax=Paralvinella palmiformis TaxID=53620 RepID=A0AAD9NFR0_9ANNE|nr:hypothetical protein LSH36_37g10091 [Paralvinella palmiformis]